MSDTSEEVSFHGEQLLRRSRTESLRGQMRAFLSDTPEIDLKERRAAIPEGERLSEIVERDRDERF